MTSLVSLAGAFAQSLLIALAPYAVSLDPRAKGASPEFVVALAIVWVAVLLAAAVSAWRRSRLASVASVATLVAAILAAVLFRGAEGPVARGVWFVAPLAWLALAAGAHAALPASTRSTVRLGVPLAVALIGAVSLAVAAPRLQSRTAMWTAVIARDPGHETAVLSLIAPTAGTSTDARAAELLARCIAANAGACRCVTRAAELDMHAGRLAAAARTIEQGLIRCSDTPGFTGLQADAWMRVGRHVDGQRLADAALDRDPRDAHALYASAAALYASGDNELAVRFASRAEAAGYGDDATLLVGVLDLSSGDVDRAARAFRRVRDHQPTNATPVYNLALIADRAQHYHDAREGYLAALRLDPTLVDARYNLALLTFRAGVLGEARHNLEELERVAPTDARLPALRQTLSPGE